MSTSTTISPDADLVTLINVFNVDPARQQELVEALARATREVFMTVPGFISANLHVGLDGKRVINYAQWASEELFRQALQRPDVSMHIAETTRIAESYDPTLVRVHSVHHAAERQA
ncbi:antibiotic biosynthesis monooxygenase family protein [Nocardia arthritidis]|nr:antibiotic biosynthesis monooxygenase family protein [Nocardia arthritidis]